MMRKKRSDRNYVLYFVQCEETGDQYIGLTVSQGRAYLKTVALRWRKHVNRAMNDGKDWKFCSFLRKNAELSYVYGVIEVVRGRKAAYSRERELIAEFNPSLNTF
jgi:hypothetical protein